MLILRAIYLLPFVFDFFECRGQITCPCGETKSNFTTFSEENSNSCHLFQFCRECSDYINRCILCPPGRDGKFCTEISSTNSTVLPKENNNVKTRHKRSHCHDLDPPKFGSMSCITRPYDKICTGTCMPGYLFEQNEPEVIRTCRNERWIPSSTYPKCISSGACDLQLVGAGGHNCTASATGTYCDISCYGDHSSDRRYHCYPGEAWTPPLPSCVQRKHEASAVEIADVIGTTCPSLQNVINGRMDPENDEPQSPGSVVTYTCDNGFTLYGQSHLTCQSDGTWSSDEPACVGDPEVVYCTDPGQVRYADRQANTMDFAAGSVVSYSCYDNYEMEGESELVCQDSGLWSAKKPICTKAKLPSNTSPMSYCQYTTVPLNTEIKLIARSGTETGWTNSIAEAIRMLGKQPSNSHIQEIEEGYKIRYKCRSHYYSFVGSVHQTCEKSGRWSGRLPTCVPKCGHSDPPKTPYIHRGNATTIGQWPWQVAVVLQESRQRKATLVCGGSLLEDRWILTAAHCVTQQQSKRLTDSRKLFAYMGKYYRSFTEDDDQVQRRSVRQVIIHGDYNYVNLDSDIALLEMDSPVELNGRIRPICLPDDRTTRDNIKDSKVGVVTGWGLTDKNKYSDILMEAKLPVLSHSQCEEKYLQYFGSITITENMFCAGYDEGKIDSCKGDSGGPMVFFDSRSNRWVQEGIVSWGNKDGCGLAYRYSGFTRVHQFINWINEYI